MNKYAPFVGYEVASGTTTLDWTENKALAMKSFNLARGKVELYQHLGNSKKMLVLSKQSVMSLADCVK